jgi:poly(3-hydroxybutyrate) depolymerase
MLSRRKLFGFLAAAPVAGVAAVKAAQATPAPVSTFRITADRFIIGGDMIVDGTINANRLTMSDYNMGTVSSGSLDDAPELTDEWFENADLHHSGKLIQRGKR